MNILQQVTRRLERLEALDKVATPLAGAVGRAVRPRVVRNLLSGTDLGASPAPGADRPADRSVGDVGPAGRRRRPGRRGGRRPAGNCRRGGRRADRGCRAAGTWEGTCASSSAWMSTAPRGSSGRASGRRCWPTPKWPIGSFAGPTRAAYRSCCTGQTERCMPRPAPALTWAARCRRTQSAMAASPAHGPAAPSGSPTAASCAARPARQSPATRRASRTGVSRSAPSHRRCGPQPSARVVTEDTVLRASNGPDRRGCSITERRISRATRLAACHYL
jgi:hypothetical protein